MKTIGVFGCKSTTIFLLESLQKHVNIACVTTISPQAGYENEVADYANLKEYCQKEDINCYTAERYDLKSEADIHLFQKMQLDIAFVIGWQRLIPKEVLQTFSIGVFGMHGSTDDLPVGRGRSPMNWGIIEQRQHFFTNIFRYDPGVDSGDILDTFVFSIQDNDTSETMHYKNVLAMKTLIIKNLKNFMSGELHLKKQKDCLPTYYPKRSPQNSLIDWNKDIFQLNAFIRAVTKPFNGAFSYINNDKLIIWRASIFETDLVDFGYRECEYGMIVEIYPSGKFLINCRGGLLIIHEYKTNIVIEKEMICSSPQEKIRHFAVNQYGYHDL